MAGDPRDGRSADNPAKIGLGEIMTRDEELAISGARLGIRCYAAALAGVPANRIEHILAHNLSGETKECLQTILDVAINELKDDLSQ